MDAMGICFSGLYYGADQYKFLKKILRRNRLLFWTGSGGRVYIRPDTPRNREIMERDGGATEADRVKASGRY